MPKSPSYKIVCCNCDCNLLDCIDGEICWGTVQVANNTGEPDYDWIHACEGHVAVLSGFGQNSKYIPEKKSK